MAEAVRRHLPWFRPGFLLALFRLDAVGGLLALTAAAVAVVWANSPGAGAYDDLRALQLGPLDLQHWAADGALAVFFFVAGLELKHELVDGALRRPSHAAMPVSAAAFGVLVPVVTCLAVTRALGGDTSGWAVPAATDIAFALAVLAIAGRHLPGALRTFMLALAVVDDVLVIALIAVFFSSSLHLGSLAICVGLLALYALAQRMRVDTPLVVVPLAVGAWWFMHEGGIHATVAGVLVGLLTRARTDAGEHYSPAARWEHRLSPWSAGLAVPFFALMSAGVVVTGGAGLARDPVLLGIVAGLVFAKPVGVLAGTWMAARATRSPLPPGLTWPDLSGAAMLAGIGFTVSLLVSELSFDGTAEHTAKAAVLAGSTVAAVAGACVVWARGRRHASR